MLDDYDAVDDSVTDDDDDADDDANHEEGVGKRLQNI